jgi:hypothetical protein
MAAAPMNLNEAEALQGSQNLPTREKREFHSEISTTSSAADGAKSLEVGAK